MTNVLLTIGDNFYSVEDTRHYEVVKITNSIYYACTFCGSSSSVICISKETSIESFKANFKDNYCDALEQSIIDDEKQIQSDKDFLVKLQSENPW